MMFPSGDSAKFVDATSSLFNSDNHEFRRCRRTRNVIRFRIGKTIWHGDQNYLLFGKNEQILAA